MENGSIAVQALLSEQFRSQKLRNPAYSLRAFARRLKVSPSALSEVLNGKRPVTLKAALQILPRLAVTPMEQERVLAAFGPEAAARQSPAPKEVLRLSADQFCLLADWYHFAILSLAETDGFRDEAAWVAERLNIRPVEARIALERLERLGLLERESKTGRLRPTGKPVSSPDNIANSALQKSHSEFLEIARRKLEEVDVKHRDFVGMTMAIDPKRLPRAKTMIRRFAVKLSEYLESGEKSEVFRLNLQLLPLTQMEEETTS